VETDLITTAWRAWLVRELHDWLPAAEAQVQSGGPAAIESGGPGAIESGGPAAIQPTDGATTVDRTGRHRDPYGARVDAALDRIVVRLVREGELEPM
jgi:hypothetical protein